MCSGGQIGPYPRSPPPKSAFQTQRQTVSMNVTALLAYKYHITAPSIFPITYFFSSTNTFEMALLGSSQLVRLSLLLLLLDLALAHPGLTFNIVSLGAKADGRTDASFALQTAWGHACGSLVPATIYVPNGTFYVQSGTFSGPCKNNAITVRIDGTLVASSDIEVLANTPSWMAFRHLNGLSIYGGVLDGQGKGLWACKKSRSGCPVGATVLNLI